MPMKSQERAKPAVDVDDSSDSDDWGSDSESSSESSDDGDKYQNIRDRFLKKTGPAQDDDEDKDRKREERRKERKEKDRRKMRNIDEEDGEGEWETVKGGVAIPSVRTAFERFRNGCLLINVYSGEAQDVR